MFTLIPPAKSPSRMIAAISASVVFLCCFLAPINLPLYTLLMFPLPDPRMRNLDEEFKQLAAFHVKKKDLSIRTASGEVIRGWFFELPGTRRVILHSHGKGDNIFGKLRQAKMLLSCGCSVLIYDYRGFGQSDGRISVGGACADVVSVYDYLIDVEHRTPSDIIAWGESFGCGPTGQLVTRRRVGGVVLQAGFSSLVRAGRDRFAWLRLYPDWSFPQQLRLDNVAVFSKPHPPLLIIHGTNDTVLPYANAAELYQKALPSKTILTVQNAGHCAWGTRDQFATTFNRFLQTNNL